MMCRRCNHPRDAHTRKDQRCRIQVLTKWDEELGKFTGHRPCVCPGYDGPLPLENLTCPHEVQPQGEHPNRCVHCGDTITAQKGHR